ncbi:PREDICTED: leucine-rich repeat extensin-like protein 5 [Corvus brachyrhynchos]|uniref:leucine-rich repeat extensin-like protein 5 n=1 Tax=Corvus brachyrhynchos TaxID=85066 RepID=UPI0008167B51|nr:PREDICTED: leucine-rich repeat extensin-like protein 5 [Corvus brachyrhynchos]
MSHPFHLCSLIPHVPSLFIVLFHHPPNPTQPSFLLPVLLHPIPLSHVPSPTTSHPSCASFMSQPFFHCPPIVHPSLLPCCHPLCSIPPCHPPPSPTRSHPSFLCSSISHHVLSLLPVLYPPSCSILSCALLSLTTSNPSLFSPTPFRSHPSFQSVLSSTVSHPSLPCCSPPLPTMFPPTLLCSCILCCILFLLVLLHHPPPPIPSSCAPPLPSISHPPVFLQHFHPIPLTCSSFIHHILFFIFIHPPFFSDLLFLLHLHPVPSIRDLLCLQLFLSCSCQHLTMSSSAPTTTVLYILHQLIPAYPPLAPIFTPTCFNLLHSSSSPHLSSSSSLFLSPLSTSFTSPSQNPPSPPTNSPSFQLPMSPQFTFSTSTFPIPFVHFPSPHPSSFIALQSVFYYPPKCLSVPAVILVHLLLSPRPSSPSPLHPFPPPPAI